MQFLLQFVQKALFSGLQSILWFDRDIFSRARKFLQIWRLEEEIRKKNDIKYWEQKDIQALFRGFFVIYAFL